MVLMIRRLGAHEQKITRIFGLSIISTATTTTNVLLLKANGGRSLTVLEAHFFPNRLCFRGPSLQHFKNC